MKIPISWFANQGYCEYILHLRGVKGVRAPDTVASITGTEAHNSLDSEYRATSITSDLPIERLISDAIQYGKPDYKRDVEVESKKLIGRIDEVRIYQHNILVLDDKPLPPTKQPYPGEIRQVIAYSLAFLIKYHALFRGPFPHTQPILMAGIVDRDAGNIFWQKTIDEKDKDEIDSTVRRMEAILNGGPSALARPSKCVKCQFSPVCDQPQNQSQLQQPASMSH